MWCDKCHSGSENTNLPKGTKCSQCGRGSFILMESPFPEKKMEGKGSGKPRSSYRKPADKETPSVETV